ncbi:5-deoxy-glucuronate isomerase [Oscillospiraceae bacterium MB08-C2-2]|nr:5-deoxy-glucuronate isomerase [Oscillospiraceae bacterium MB08-C2-2]
MIQIHFKPEELLQRLEPKAMQLTYTSAQRIELKDTEVIVESGNEEVCLVCISGQADYTYHAQSGEAVLRDILYLPTDAQVVLKSKSAVFIRFGAPCTRKTTFAHIVFKEVDGDSRHKVYGKQENGTKRDVWNCIDEAFDSARFLVGFCKGCPGGWTAWPPHEHAEKREETYVYFDMANAFGAQFVYDELDNPHDVALIQEGHLVSIPSGYHPNCGCPAGAISYVYCMVSTTEDDRNFMDLTTQKIYGDKLE